MLGNHLLAQGSACRVVIKPEIVPRVRANRNYRVPDLGVTCAPPSRDSMLPEPVLLLEILSASNEAESWANIWTYISIPSVTEILADQQHTDRGRAAAPPSRRKLAERAGAHWSRRNPDAARYWLFGAACRAVPHDDTGRALSFACNLIANTNAPLSHWNVIATDRS